MTKRFTPKASDFTQRMADLQARKAKLVKELRELEKEENALKSFLLPFYDEGKTEVDTGETTLTVNFSVQPRTYLDQDKAIAILNKMGKKVPYFQVDIINFKVKEAK
jgi:hypothetical protein